jgi:hypothetical protein
LVILVFCFVLIIHSPGPEPPSRVQQFLLCSYHSFSRP